MNSFNWNFKAFYGKILFPLGELEGKKLTLKIRVYSRKD